MSPKTDFKVDETVRVDGVPARLVELADGTGRVESFVNGRWVPGGCSVKGLFTGTAFSDQEGEAR